MPRLATAPVLLVAATLTLAACGGGSASGPPSGGGVSSSGRPSGGSGAGSTLKVSADPKGRLHFMPRSLRARAGTVQVDFTNQAPLQHDFCIKSPAGGQVGCTNIIQRSSTSKTFNLTPGTYTFYCSVDGHESAGMTGKLKVS